MCWYHLSKEMNSSLIFVQLFPMWWAYYTFLFIPEFSIAVFFWKISFFDGMIIGKIILLTFLRRVIVIRKAQIFCQSISFIYSTLIVQIIDIQKDSFNVIYNFFLKSRTVTTKFKLYWNIYSKKWFFELATQSMVFLWGIVQVLMPNDLIKNWP